MGRNFLQVFHTVIKLSTFKIRNPNAIFSHKFPEFELLGDKRGQIKSRFVRYRAKCF